MSKLTFYDICRWLEDNNFRRVSKNGDTNYVYHNEDNTIMVTVTENLFTEEDEELVKERLRQLGYLV